MTDDVLKYAPIIISLLALWISYRGYSVARRGEKRALDATKPVISASIISLDPWQPNWFTVQLKIENRAAYGFRGDAITFVRPDKAVGLSYAQAFVDPYGAEPKIKVPLPLDEAVRRMPVVFQVSKAGISGRPHPHSIDEQHHETIYVHAPAGWFKDYILLRVKLASLEGVERIETVTVHRKLPGRSWRGQTSRQ